MDGHVADFLGDISKDQPPPQIPPGHPLGKWHEGLLNIIAAMAPITVNIHQMA